MIDPPESTNDKLNREISRLRKRQFLDKLKSPTGWGVIVACIAFGALMPFMSPKNIDMATGIAGETTLLSSRYGTIPGLFVTIGTETLALRFSAGLAIHYNQGDTVCLNAATHLLTRRSTYRIVEPALCTFASRQPASN